MLRRVTERMNKKSKKQQLFVLLMLCIGIFGVLCLTGCGGGTCEKPKCNTEENTVGKVSGCSIPGCGGCLTPEKGCNTSCWAQSCKCISFSGNEEQQGENVDRENDKSQGCIKACDIKYYGDGCLGCGQKEKSCYYGVGEYKNGEDEKKGFFYGNSDGGNIIGCSGGCVSCIGTGKTQLESLNWLEFVTGVK